MAGLPRATPEGSSLLLDASSYTTGVADTSAFSDGSKNITRCEHELRGAVETHIAHLEQQLVIRDNQIAAMKQHMEATMRDFRVNEALIADRDADLDEMTRVTERLQREKASLMEQLNSERAIAADATRRAQELTSQLQSYRVHSEETKAALDAQNDRIRMQYEKELGDLRAKYDKDISDEARARIDKLHDTEAERKRQMAEVEGVCSEKVKVANLRSEAMLDQIGVLENTIEALREELQNVRSASHHHEVELMQARNNTQDLQQSHEVERTEHNQSVALLHSKLQELQSMHQSKMLENTERSRRSATEASNLRHELQKTQLELESTTTERDELLTRERKTVEAYKEECGKVEKRFDELRDDMEAKVKKLLSTQSSMQRTIDNLTTERDELHHRLSTVSTSNDDHLRGEQLAQRQLEDQQEVVKRLKSQLLEVERRLKDELSVSASTLDSLRVSQQTANEAVETLRKDLDQSRTNSATEIRQLKENASRLQRELASSEAIRLEVEEQLQSHLHTDASQAVSKLTAERNQLLDQVRTLETTNEAIRGQISQFTQEMQNDPVLKTAKETALRAAKLKEDVQAGLRRESEMKALSERQDRELQTLNRDVAGLRAENHRLVAGEHADVADLKRQLREQRALLDAVHVSGSGADGMAAQQRAANARIESLESRMSSMQEERRQLEKRVASLTKENDELRSITNAQHAELMAYSRSDKAVKGISDVLTPSIHTNERLMVKRAEEPTTSSVSPQAALPAAVAAAPAVSGGVSAADQDVLRRLDALTSAVMKLEPGSMPMVRGGHQDPTSSAESLEVVGHRGRRQSPGSSNCQTCVATERVRSRSGTRNPGAASSGSIYAADPRRGTRHGGAAVERVPSSGATVIRRGGTAVRNYSQMQ